MYTMRDGVEAVSLFERVNAGSDPLNESISLGNVHHTVPFKGSSVDFMDDSIRDKDGMQQGHPVA